MTKLTRKIVEQEIQKTFGYQVELVKGNGYFYFVFENSFTLPSTSVFVNSVNQLSLQSWLFEFEQITLKLNK